MEYNNQGLKYEPGEGHCLESIVVLVWLWRNQWGLTIAEVMGPVRSLREGLWRGSLCTILGYHDLTRK